jgi:hypothetical protein
MTEELSDGYIVYYYVCNLYRMFNVANWVCGISIPGTYKKTAYTMPYCDAVYAVSLAIQKQG